MKHYPVNLVVDGRSCLIVGGGPVAARKADGLLQCGALVTVIAPEIVPELEFRSDLLVLRRKYQRGEAGSYWLVITATNDQRTNQDVYDDAVEAQVWVNSADDPQRCAFTLPAVHRQGDVLLTVSTHGSSPALASWLRDELAACIGPEFAALAERLAERRRLVHAGGGSTETQNWRGLIRAEVLAMGSQRR